MVACDEADGDCVVGFVSFEGSYITWMYVDPDYHRRGIAKRLLSEAVSIIGPDAWVNTMDGNTAALALYGSAGFDIVKSFESDCNGYPCVCLRLALPTSPMHDPAAKAGG